MERTGWLHRIADILVSLVLLVACATPATPTPVPPTATSMPTLTPQPTVNVAAIQTAAAATVVAQVALDATATAVAVPTRTLTPTPTDTPLPTATSTNTPKPAPKPSKTPTPATILELSGMRYETWGNPQHGCSSFDNSTLVRKFNLEIKLTNQSSQAVREWYPDFYSHTGRLVLTCFYVYSAEGFPTVPPGESRTVTFASFCNLDEYIAEMKMKVLEVEHHLCFTPEGSLGPCP